MKKPSDGPLAVYRPSCAGPRGAVLTAGCLDDRLRELLAPLSELLHDTNAPQLTFDLWVELFPHAWAQLRSAEQEALVKRSGDDSWPIVNWQLSRHSGRWLTAALTITE